MPGTIQMEDRYLGRCHGYVNKYWLGMKDEPQALYEEDQRKITLRSHIAFAENRGAELVRRDNHRWLERLRRAEMTAIDRGIDIFRSQATIRREILNMEYALEGKSVRPGGTI